MRKILLLQLDGPYFLFETLRVLEKNARALKGFEVTLLVDPKSYAELSKKSIPSLKGITTKVSDVLGKDFEMSFNLSLDEGSWELHSKIKSQKKQGPFYVGSQLMVPDLWSTFLLTLKSRSPFLTFHLQDIYRNILGIKDIQKQTPAHTLYKSLVFGFFNTDFISSVEQEKLIHTLHDKFPLTRIQDISEIDLVEDLSDVLYLGPASLNALRVCEAGAKGVFVAEHFSGFNLLPSGPGHLQISSLGTKPTADQLVGVLESILKNEDLTSVSGLSFYETAVNPLFGNYLKGVSSADDNHPFYQAHLVLWNFILNLHDVQLDHSKKTSSQLQTLKMTQEVLTKLIRLQDYAMSSIDTIYHQAKNEQASAEIVNGHLKNLSDIEQTTSKVAEAHAFLRPILDFYRIRRGQNDGSTLLEQVENSLLTYSEEQYALKAMQELLTIQAK
jgi:hypothetical protein